MQEQLGCSGMRGDGGVNAGSVVRGPETAIVDVQFGRGYTR